MSCTAASRSFASCSCRTTVSAASALVRVNTSRTTVWVSVTGATTVPMSTLTAGVPGDVSLSGRAGAGGYPAVVTDSCSVYPLMR
jgi:hypothetical protein